MPATDQPDPAVPVHPPWAWPLHDPARLVLEVALFAAAVVVLVAAGHPVAATVLGVVALLTVPLSHRPEWLRGS